MSSDITGRCFCNGVQFTLENKPALFVACHCRDCQYASGGAPANIAVVAASDLTIASGEDLLSAYTCIADSGRKVTRQFCSVCGTPMFEILELDLGMRLVKAGTLDDQNELRLDASVWMASAQAWRHTELESEHFARDLPMPYVPRHLR